MSASVGDCKTVLLVSPSIEDYRTLERIFGDSCWQLQGALTALDALDAIGRDPLGIAVIICDHHLTVYDWRWLLGQLDQLPAPPSLIVASRVADERLWAEVLNLGAFDLLLGGPFEPEEVLRVTESAVRMRRPHPQSQLRVATMP